MRKLVIGMAMASTALASPALARDGQWYVEVDGGVMIIEDQDFIVNDDADTIGIDSEDYGFDVGGIVGYDFGAFRIEAEASYREWEIETVAPGALGFAQGTPPFTGAPTAANGDPNILSFMANALFDFGDDDGIQAFGGAGIGVARTDYDARISSVTLPGIDDSDTGLAWQLLAGVRAPL
ncbi:outer membrane beta-barrel protein, partial [Sphingomonadaceae bacterium]|nr:outer membrane beta-barrel protein [Sphingomonadaceae bacterium]